MPRPKGSQNKITSEVKDKLQLLIDDLIDSLNVKELDANQRIKMLQIVLLSRFAELFKIEIEYYFLLYFLNK